MKKYLNEQQGQMEFFEKFLPMVDSTLTEEQIFNDYTDGIVRGNLLEFKLVVSDLSLVLGQAIRYLSAMRLKGKSIPRNIILVSLNPEIAYIYNSEDYLNEIEKVYIGGASKGINGFSASTKAVEINYNSSNHIGLKKLIEILRSNLYTKINIDENCIVGWAERYYKEKPKANKADFIGDSVSKVKIIGEIRKPTYFEELIHPYKKETNVQFQYLMDRLNDSLRKKDLGAFYTPIKYAEKSYELLYKAIERVPEGNDYVIIDRCAGTGNLQLNLPDEILEKCILSTIEYYEYKVLLELLGDKVKYIIPPFDEEGTFESGLVRGADALSEGYINNSIFKEIIDDPKMTIILFENPPYAEVNGTTRGANSKSLWKNSYVAKAIKEKIGGRVVNDMANLFIWSGFEYYLRQDTDSYVVYAPIKYWKSQQIINKNYIEGFAFNRKHFHAKTDAMISCILWGNEDKDLKSINLKAFDLLDNELDYQGELKIERVYSLFSKGYFDKRNFPGDEETGICTNLNGEEKLDGKGRVKKVYNENIIAYLIANGQGFDNPRLNSGMVVSNRYDSNGFRLRKDNYITKLPMFAAGKYTDHFNDWKIMSNIMKSADGKKRYDEDISKGKIDNFLLKNLFWTSLTHYSHIRTFSGTDGRFYRNELCLDTTNGETLATIELKKLKMNQTEIDLKNSFLEILNEAKTTENYNEKYTYGLYQIDEELNTKEKDEETNQIIPDYPHLNGLIKNIKTEIKEYYKNEISEYLFKYEFLK